MPTDRLYRRDDSPYWWAIYYGPDGKRRRECTKCSDKKAAYDWLRNAERRAVSEASRGPGAPKVSLREALVRFLESGTGDLADETKEMYATRAVPLLAHLGERDINELAREEIRSYIQARRLEPIKHKVNGELVEIEPARYPTDNTLQKEMITLRRALLLAEEDDLFVGDVNKVVPKFSFRNVPRKTWLSFDEYKKLDLALATEKHRLWVQVAVFLGARLSEVSGLDWADVDFESRTVHVRGTKTAGSDRIVPLATVLYERLYPLRQSSGLVVGTWGKVCRDLAVACARAGVPRVSPNDLRRTFASWLKQAGVDSMHVASLMGHTSTRMVESVYGRLDQKTLRGAMSKLPELGPAKEPSES